MTNGVAWEGGGFAHLECRGNPCARLEPHGLLPLCSWRQGRSWEGAELGFSAQLHRASHAERLEPHAGLTLPPLLLGLWCKGTGSSQGRVSGQRPVASPEKAYAGVCDSLWGG